MGILLRIEVVEVGEEYKELAIREQVLLGEAKVQTLLGPDLDNYKTQSLVLTKIKIIPVRLNKVLLIVVRINIKSSILSQTRSIHPKRKFQEELSPQSPKVSPWPTGIPPN